MKTWLLDTGPLVAYLDTDDADHAEAERQLDGFRGILCTSTAVIAEAMYFVQPDPDGPAMLAAFLESSRLEVFDFSRAAQLKLASELMRKYFDTPMDYADATLILLAELVDATDICTLDRRGFSIYRTRSGRRFNLVGGR